MRESTKKRYKDAILDMYIQSRENGGYITSREKKEIIIKRQTDSLLTSGMSDCGYLRIIGRGKYQLTQEFHTLNILKINNAIKKRYWQRKTKQMTTKAGKSNVVGIFAQEEESIPLRITLSTQQQRECAIALLDEKPYSFNITDKEQIKSIIINYINEK